MRSGSCPMTWMEDSIDDFMNHVDDKDTKPDGFMEKIKSSLGKMKARRRVGKEIEDLKKQIVEVAERNARYKTREAFSKTINATVDPRALAIFEHASKLVGIDEPKEIIKMLTEEDESAATQEQLKLVSIVGSGGMGKTTLANQVYQELKGQFQCRAFLSVSRNPDMMNILRTILSEVSGQRYADTEAGSIQQLIAKISDFLADKRYFIVIDDIWDLSIFPEDTVIEKKDLIRSWIAEGFIHKEGRYTVHEIGERCFNELLNRSLIQPVKTNKFYGVKEACCPSLAAGARAEGGLLPGRRYQIGIRYAGGARMALALSLKSSAVPIVVPVWVRDFDIDGELWVKLRLIPTEPWVGAVSWAFVSLPKIKFELSLFRFFNLMAIPVLSMFLTKLLTEDLPRLFVRPKKIVLDFQQGRAMGPVAGDVASDIIQNVASGIMQDVATDLIQDGNKDFVGELSVTLVDARKLSFVLFGKTDPYVAMILGDQVIKSKKNSQTTVTGLPGEPIWNQDFHLLVANPRKQKLRIQVKDSIGLTDITIGTGEVDLGSLKDTVPTDKIVTLYGGWGFFGKRSSGEVLLRLTYKAYVEEEEDEEVKSEYAVGYVSDEDVLDYVQISRTKPSDFNNGNERETFMDLLAALLVSEEFQGIVSSSETRSSIDSEQVEESEAGDDVTTGTVSNEITVSNSPEDRALVWLAAITSVMLLVSSNLGGSGYFNP